MFFNLVIEFIAIYIVTSASLLPTYHPLIIHSTSTHTKLGLCIGEYKVVFKWGVGKKLDLT